MLGKKELINRIAEKGEFTKGLTENFIDILSDVVIDALEKGESVKVGKIATFEVVEVDEAERRNPKTDEAVIVEAHRKVRTKISDTVKNRVW